MSGEDLEERVARLEADVRDLRSELRPRGPFGLPRPPTPGELIRATDEHAIPAVIASLTAAIHALELLRAVLRASGHRPRADAAPAGTGTGSASAGRVGAAALARLDGALSDLSGALSGAPPDSETRDLLAEVRELRDEIAARVEDAGGEPAASATGDEPAGRSVGARGDAAESAVDIEAELDSIREELEDQAGEGA